LSLLQSIIAGLALGAVSALAASVSGITDVPSGIPIPVSGGMRSVLTRTGNSVEVPGS